MTIISEASASTLPNSGEVFVATLRLDQIGPTGALRRQTHLKSLPGKSQC
jgi:hypothetical protein